MTEDEKMQVAVFRYSVISDLVSVKNLDWGEQERLIREKCAHKWSIPFSEKTRIGRSCILGWIRAYRESNEDIKSLFPRDRQDKGKSRALDEDTCLGLVRLRKEMPSATVPQVIEQMYSRNLVTCDTDLRLSTVYRFLDGQDLMKPLSTPVDRRRFEAELSNDLWQSDVMHGPRVEVDGRQRKTYLVAILDDHSRLIAHAEFFLSEALKVYLQALEEAFARRGLPRKLYVDNGPAFRSRHLEYVTAALNISLIHARPYTPQGKGKIERWFKTIRTQFLPGFRGQTLPELNEALDLWIQDVYHQRKHSATGQTPFERFTAHVECMRPAPKNLKDYFRKVARRKVAKDRGITFKGRLYEAPMCLIGQQVELLYHETSPEGLEIRWRNKSYGMARPVDLHVNCRIKRDENNKQDVIITSGRTDYKGGKLL